MTAMAERISDYGNNFDFRSMLESKLNEKKSELGETELNIKKIGGSRLGSARGVESSGERLSSFKNRLGPVVSSRGGRSAPQTFDRRTSINSRLGPRVSNSQDDTVEENDISNAMEDSNGFGGEVTGRGSVMSRIVVEKKSREDALAEQNVDKKENQRNKRIFGSILGTLQKFRADETKDKDRELKKRKIEAKIDQKTEKERAEAIKQKQELFEDKKKKELEIKVLQVQMKRAEEFEIWERSKRKEQKYIRTKNSSTKIYYLPKNHNDSTLTALENTMDEIDEEIRTARELFEEELQKISTRAEQNPNASVEDLEGDDNSGDENETDQTTKSIVSAIRKPNEEKSTNSKEVQKENGQVSLTNRKMKDKNKIADQDERSIKNGVKDSNDTEDAKSAHRNNIDKKANNHDDSNMISAEKSQEGNSDTIDTHNDARKETVIGNHIIPEVKSDSKDIADIRNTSNDKPIKKSIESNGHQDSNSKSKRRSGESCQTYSPDSNERKKHKSGSYNDDLQISRGLRDESSDKTKRKNIKNSGRLDEKEKRHKQNKKKRDSSSDSSSNSSSSDEQSDSDKSSTNSSSYSDSSDDSSSDSDAKRKSKKPNSKKSRSKKPAREKEKDKSSNIHKREGRVSRKKSGRKSSIRKHSDSSD